MNDGHGIFYTGIRDEEDLWRSVLPYRDSGYAALHFCITGADHCNYPTRVGTLLGEELDDFPAPDIGATPKASFGCSSAGWIRSPA